MAQSWKNGVMSLDSQGQGFSGRAPVDYSINPDGSWVTNPATSKQRKNTQFRADTITVDCSAANWVVVLSNQDGSLVFSQRSSAATGSTYFGQWDFNGVVLTTATNVTRVNITGTSIQF